MSLLFNRAAAFTFGQNLSIATAKRVSGLRVAFEITKTSSSSPNPAKITVYNLSKDSRSKLEGTDIICRLEAGYLGDTNAVLTTLFEGDVIRVTTERNGPDILSVIEAGDAERAITTKHIDKSFAPLTSLSQVLTSLSNEMGVALGSITGFASDLFKGGLSLSGLVSDQLNNLTAKAGLEWHVTDNQLNVIPSGPTGSILEEAVVLSSTTGLIGVPSKSEEGIIFQSLLNPKIKPGGRIVLSSGQIKGTFKVKKVTHQGDTRGDTWLSKVEAE